MIKFCSLYSGSSGNSMFLSANGTKILIDAGVSAKKITDALHEIGEEPAEIDALLVTHEHSDHVRGAGILSRKYKLPVYANERTWEAMESAVMPIVPDHRRIFRTTCEFMVGGIAVNAFHIPHDALEPVGFNFFVNNKKITTATDIGHITRELLGYLENSDLLLLECNHDIEMLKVGPYPYALKRRILSNQGHLSNEMAGKVIAYMAEKGTKKFLLGHLSKENNFPELAYQTVFSALCEKKISPDEEWVLDVVHRDRVGKVIVL